MVFLPACSELTADMARRKHMEAKIRDILEAVWNSDLS